MSSWHGSIKPSALFTCLLWWCVCVHVSIGTHIPQHTWKGQRSIWGNQSSHSASFGFVVLGASGLLTLWASGWFYLQLTSYHRRVRLTDAHHHIWMHTTTSGFLKCDFQGPSTGPQTCMTNTSMPLPPPRVIFPTQILVLRQIFLHLLSLSERKWNPDISVCFYATETWVKYNLGLIAYVLIHLSVILAVAPSPLLYTWPLWFSGLWLDYPWLNLEL